MPDACPVLSFETDEITLLTNDPSSPTIPVSVSATIQPAVTIAPSPLILGQVRAGEVVRKTVLVRSSQPFKVTGIKAEKGDLSAANVPDVARPFHALAVTLKAPTQPGPYNATLEIATDVKDEPPAKVTAFATIVP